MIKSRTTKLLLRAAFHIHDRKLLPLEVLWRMKEAFSDGVSTQRRSWYEVIQEHVKQVSFNVDEQINAAGDHMTPTTKEQAWYRKLFCDEYPNRDQVIPYFWMPNWVDAVEQVPEHCSAINAYSTNDEENDIIMNTDEKLNHKYSI